MSSTPPHIVLDNTLGAAFVGVVVAAILHGVSCVQAWYYFTHQADAWPVRLLVAAVMLFDTIHQALISHTVYTYVITNYFDPTQLGMLVWSMLVEVLFNGLTALLVQSFLAMRVWRLSNRNIWITSVVLLLICGEFACILAFAALSLHMRTFAELAELKYLSITVNALAAAGDVLIAATLCTLLHRSRTGFHRSDTMINKLILFAVNTGFLTSLCAVASLISILVAGQTFLYIAFFFCIGRLYSNSLLATLNARKMIRGAADAIHSTSDNLSLSLRDISLAKGHTSAGGGGIGIGGIGGGGGMGVGGVGGTSISGKASQMASMMKRPTNISINIHTTKELTSDSDQGHDTLDIECPSPKNNSNINNNSNHRHVHNAGVGVVRSKFEGDEDEDDEEDVKLDSTLSSPESATYLDFKQQV